MSKQLVAYFSASGVTRKLAKNLADAIGADLFEIAPERPYTSADLDWTNKQSRSTVEMQDESARPEMAKPTPNVAAYDTIYVGFPVWWYVEPRIIDTFLESADFGGKTIVPFATSGGSGLGQAPKRMAGFAKGAKVKQGKLLNGHQTSASLKAWAESAAK